MRMLSVAGAMVSETVADLLCAGLAASETVAVKVKLPLAVGVPETTPVVEPRVSPAGRAPAVTDQV